MTFLAVGINYNTAPVSIRERLSFPADRLESSLKELWRLKEINEAAILSTCNRTEFYCTATTAGDEIDHSSVLMPLVVVDVAGEHHEPRSR